MQSPRWENSAGQGPAGAHTIRGRPMPLSLSGSFAHYDASDPR